MSDMAESLILGSGEQLALLEVDNAGLPAAAYEIAEQAGRFTGDRIFSQNPRLYNAIVALLGRALPYREISEICGVSVNTVCAISQREGVPIETIRERIGRLSLDVAQLTIEAIRDMLADPAQRSRLSLKDLSIAFGISTQNGQLLLGGATQRIETVEAQPGHDEYLRYMKDVTGTGLAAENPALKALPGSGVTVDLPAADAAQVPAPRLDALPVQPASN